MKPLACSSTQLLGTGSKCLSAPRFSLAYTRLNSTQSLSKRHILFLDPVRKQQSTRKSWRKGYVLFSATNGRNDATFGTFFRGIMNEKRKLWSLGQLVVLKVPSEVWTWVWQRLSRSSFWGIRKRQTSSPRGHPNQVELCFSCQNSHT